jgi:hypothetical protein
LKRLLTTSYKAYFNCCTPPPPQMQAPAVTFNAVSPRHIITE